MKKFVFDEESVRNLPSSPQVSIPDGLPFILDDHFAPVADLNAWLLSLRERGSHSRRTWSAYADDLLAWNRFLERRGSHLLDSLGVLKMAVADYRECRLQGDPFGEFAQLGPSAWNRAVAAMENFYKWAEAENKIAAKPFRYRQVRVFKGGEATTVDSNLAKAQAGSPLTTMRHLERDFADLFVDVGLGGQTPDGEPDPAFRGRLGTRNRAVGKLVRSSGLRRQEFSNLLVWEVPASPRPFSEYAGLFVSETIAKGSRSRVTWASGEALDATHDYIALERSMAVHGSRWTPTAPLQVTQADEKSGTVNGKRVRWANLSIEQRRRLVGPEGGSALLFVRSDGAPTEENNWRYTFDTAAARCRTFNPRFPVVTPHMLRHTFAMETLRELTRGSLSRAHRLAKVGATDPLLMAVLRRADPLLVLRDFLGHQSLQTTQVYLAAQDPNSILTDEELDLLEAAEELDGWRSTS